METINLKLSLREEKGKGAARKTRANKDLPGVFYGPSMKTPLTVTANTLEFAKVHKKARVNSILKIESDHKDLVGKMALLKEVQLHPVTEDRLHFDLYEVKAGEPFKLTLPIVLEGKPKGIAEGGKLQQIRRSIEIKCLPKDIPTQLNVDVSEMNIGDILHINDITLPEGVSVLGTANVTIASVVLPQEKNLTPDTDAAEEPEVAGEGGAEATAEAAEKPAE
ncbi:MAG TPA: 50S ribosomal protein L25 [Oligoflexia bacterium]|nr:50S ribosomal protein L25 [Oligoflexia bacterium]HMR25481.1 50S ribosomal protein L25 [Oligoflexia bacterium]